jgi:hypothetical protein
VSPTPLKNDGVKVSWDDEIPNIYIYNKYIYYIYMDIYGYGKIENVPNHQPDNVENSPCVIFRRVSPWVNCPFFTVTSPTAMAPCTAASKVSVTSAEVFLQLIRKTPGLSK